LLVSESGTGVRVWDPSSGRLVMVLKEFKWIPGYLSHKVRALPSPRGRYVAVLSDVTPRERSGCGTCDAFAPDDRPKDVEIFETSGWKSIRKQRIEWNEWFWWNGDDRFAVMTRTHRSLAVPRGWLYRSGDPDRQLPPPPPFRIEHWHVEAGLLGKCELSIPTGFASEVSPDHRLMAVWDDRDPSGGTIRILELETGRERQRFVCDDPCRNALFSPDGRYLLGYHPAVPLYLWDVRGLHTAAADVQPAANLEREWHRLADADPAIAFRAIQTFARLHQESVSFLGESLHAVPVPEPATTDRLVASLGAADFRERERATTELEEIGKPALTALRAAARLPSPEASRRAIDLIQKIESGPTPPAELRAIRAVEAVEWMGTAEAEALLRVWAAGAPGSRLTEDAKSALARLGKPGR
jgi:hypothetical protein